MTEKTKMTSSNRNEGQRLK